MKMSKKDQLYLMVVVPLALLLAYGFVWVKPQIRERKRLEAAEKQLGDRHSLLVRQRQLKVEHDELVYKLTEAERESEPLTGYNGKSVVVAGSTGGFRQLHESMQSYGIRLISAEAVAPEAGKLVEGGVEDTLIKSGVERPRSWNMTLDANFDAMLKLLEECSGNRCSVVTVELSMRPGGSESKTTYWTLRTCL